MEESELDANSARATRKSDKGGSSNEGASPAKKEGVDDDHKCDVDTRSCSESDGQSDGNSKDEF